MWQKRYNVAFVTSGTITGNGIVQLLGKLKEFQSLKMMSVMQDVALNPMCSKCKIHCFSHELWKISELQNFRKFLNFRKFPKNISCLNLFYSKKIFEKKMVFFWQIFQRIFHCFQDQLHCIKVKGKRWPILLKVYFKTQKCTNFIAFETITYHCRFE